jgi:HprK-related kinase A
MLYCDAEILDEPDFTDFYIRIDSPKGIRSRLRPQVNFYYDETCPFKPLPVAHAFPLFEWGLNWCIARYVHQYLLIHSAVLEKNGLAVILPGPPGSGKSTLCAAMMLRGWRLLSDEMAMVDPDTLQLAPVPRPVALKNDSIDIIRAYEPAAVISAPSYDTSKGTVAHLQPSKISMDQLLTSATPAMLVMPHYTPDIDVHYQVIDKSTMLMNIVRNSFNYNILRATGFNTACALLDRCEVGEIRYNNVDLAMQMLEQSLEGCV